MKMAATMGRYSLLANYCRSKLHVRVCQRGIERTYCTSRLTNTTPFIFEKRIHFQSILQWRCDSKGQKLFDPKYVYGNRFCTFSSATVGFDRCGLRSNPVYGSMCKLTTMYSGSLRTYCNNAENKPQPQVKRIFIGLPNPVKLIRNALFFMLIRAYFDPEFTQDSFKEGAKKALVYVSNQISSGNFDQIMGLLTKEAMEEVEQRYRRLGVKERQSIAIKEEDILYSFPHQIDIHYDPTGSKWVYILMRFWCHSMATTSEMAPEIRAIGAPKDMLQKYGTVIRCTYEFKRDFSPGVEPEWMIGFIQHGNVL